MFFKYLGWVLSIFFIVCVYDWIGLKSYNEYGDEVVFLCL